MSFSVSLSPSLSHYIRSSLVVHLIILVSIVVFSLIQGFFLKKEKRTNLLLVKSSVRVDVVAMPRLTLQELKNSGVDVNMNVGKKIVSDDLPPPAPKKTEEVEFKVKKKEVNLKDMLKQYSEKKRVEKVQKAVKSTKKASSSLDRIGKKRLKKLILAGNRLAQGNALTGDGGTEIQSQFQEYASRFPDWVRPHWNLPAYLIDRNFQCRIKIFISAGGELIRVQVVESSNEDEYDQKAIAAIKSASPFPPPPEPVRARAVKGDIILGFPL